jgi:hypothetical protein
LCVFLNSDEFFFLQFVCYKPQQQSGVVECTMAVMCWQKLIKLITKWAKYFSFLCFFKNPREGEQQNLQWRALVYTCTIFDFCYYNQPLTVVSQLQMINVLAYIGRMRTWLKTPIKHFVKPLRDLGKNNYVLF